jgi:Na+/H+-dicarboxylate symporters
LKFIDQIAHVFFNIVNMIMKLAPIGAFGAMAYTIGKYGIGSLAQLGQLIICFYITCLLFIFLYLAQLHVFAVSVSSK